MSKLKPEFVSLALFLSNTYTTRGWNKFLSHYYSHIHTYIHIVYTYSVLILYLYTCMFIYCYTAGTHRCTHWHDGIKKKNAIVVLSVDRKTTTSVWHNDSVHKPEWHWYIRKSNLTFNVAQKSCVVELFYTL